MSALTFRVRSRGGNYKRLLLCTVLAFNWFPFAFVFRRYSSILSFHRHQFLVAQLFVQNLVRVMSVQFLTWSDPGMRNLYELFQIVRRDLTEQNFVPSFKNLEHRRHGKVYRRRSDREWAHEWRSPMFIDHESDLSAKESVLFLSLLLVQTPLGCVPRRLENVHRSSHLDFNPMHSEE